MFEPFRFKGTTVKDGVTYNKYELWDGIVLIESGISVIYGRRELGKAVAGQMILLNSGINGKLYMKIQLLFLEKLKTNGIEMAIQLLIAFKRVGIINC